LPRKEIAQLLWFDLQFALYPALASKLLFNITMRDIREGEFRGDNCLSSHI
jgi:hypothetical protein